MLAIVTASLFFAPADAKPLQVDIPPGSFTATIQPTRVTHGAMSPTGTHFAVGGNGYSLFSWDGATATKVDLPWEKGDVHAIAFSADGSRLMVSRDSRVAVYDTSGSEVGNKGFDGAVFTATMSADGDTVWVAPNDDKLHEWTISTDTVRELMPLEDVRALHEHPGPGWLMVGFAGGGKVRRIMISDADLFFEHPPT